jgi:hypothetical protein
MALNAPGTLPTLQEALNSFVQGTRDLALTRSLSQANLAVQNIKGSTISEMEKRKALTQVAQSLTFDMLAKGANASQVQTAYASMAPKGVNGSDDAILQGLLQGDEQLMQAGLVADRLSAGNKLAVMQAQAGLQEQADERKFAQQEKLVSMKLGAQGGGKALTAGEIDKIQAFDASQVTLADMIKQVQESPTLVGPVASRIPGREMVSPEFAAFKQQSEQFFNTYRQQVTGAGASEKEIEMLRKASPTITDRPDVFRAKAMRALKIGEAVKQRYLQNLQSGGRNTSGFAPVSAPATGGAPGADLSRYLIRSK